MNHVFLVIGKYVPCYARMFSLLIWNREISPKALQIRMNPEVI